MSSKPKRIEITKPQATFTQSGTEEVSVGNSACDEEIRRRAYEIYLERGEQPGRDLDDLAPSRTRTRARGTLARSGLAKGSATSADIDKRWQLDIGLLLRLLIGGWTLAVHAT